MSDIFDRASDLEEFQRSNAIAAVRTKAANPARYSGRCDYCNADLMIERSRYCDSYCKEDAEMETTIRGRQYK